MIAKLAPLSTFAALWLVFFAAYTAFPYIRPGAELILEQKERLESQPHLFSNPRHAHVIIFGTSKTMAGFVPSLFDQATGPNVESHNFGLPGIVRYIPDLDRLIAAGNVPDVVLLTDPWPDPEPPVTPFRFITHDHEILLRLFPFRDLPRDLFAFLARVPAHRGIASAYTANRETLRQAERDRGYYYIAEQKRDGGMGVNLASDQPSRKVVRHADVTAPEFLHFYSQLQSHNIRCLFVPGYARVGEVAPADPLDQILVRVLDPFPLIRVLGPDYFSYPRELFSDPVHLNPDGARRYTRDLATLTGSSVSPAH